MPLSCLVKSNFLICLTIQFEHLHALLFRRNPNFLPSPGQGHAPGFGRSDIKIKRIINREDFAIIYRSNDIACINSQATGPGADPCGKNNNTESPLSSPSSSASAGDRLATLAPRNGLVLGAHVLFAAGTSGGASSPTETLTNLPC